MRLIETDALIIGAGPVGLFQVFELGLLEIKTHVIDSLPAVGGQCAELYPDKPIYDIPGIPVCTGQELTANLLEQIKPFNPHFHLNQEVTELARQDDGRFLISTSAQTRFLSKTVFIAAGVGAFQPRKLALDGIDAFENTQLFYRITQPEQFENQSIAICGGGDAALDWAIYFAGKVKRLTLIHRRDEFKASPHAITQLREYIAAGKIQLKIGQITGYRSQGGKLDAVDILDADGLTQSLPLDALCVFFGLSPKLGPISHWGLELSRKQIVVDTARFESSIPGIFAVGDINTYPGKKKLILSGFHEAALAAFGAAQYVFPEKQIQLQYTTTSPKLHQLLGVADSH